MITQKYTQSRQFGKKVCIISLVVEFNVYVVFMQIIHYRLRNNNTGD